MRWTRWWGGRRWTASGPTTLAIETARAFNITLVNFRRGSGMNIASGAERVAGL